MELLYGPILRIKDATAQWYVPLAITNAIARARRACHHFGLPMKADSHDLNDLMYFSHVVEHGGFSAAERVLGISKSRLSRRVSELEASLGVRLLQRSTRKLALTEAGQLFYQHCQAMLAEARAAVDVVQSLRDSPRGTVRVSVPVTVAQTFLSAVMPDFLHRYPEVRVVLRVTNRV